MRHSQVLRRKVDCRDATVCGSETAPFFGLTLQLGGVHDGKVILQSLAITTVFLSGLLLSGCAGTGAGGTAAISPTVLSIPLGSPVSGVTLSGSLSGKTMYLLGGGANQSHCWQDSQYWDGSKLWFGLTSVSWTRLSASPPSYSLDPACSLPAGQSGSVFNIYSASLANNLWNLVALPFNSSTVARAAPKVSGNQMAFVAYEKTNSYGNIYLTSASADGNWSAPSPFPLNTATCNEDNPDIYSGGTKMIFESSRTVADGSACAGDSQHQKLWTSNLQAGIWSPPVLLSGAPALGISSTQPWLEESTGTLYWTGDSSVCPAGVANCVLKADANGAGWSNTSQVLITPTPLSPPSAADGKVILVGQFSQANGYAFANCGIATLTDPTGHSTSTLLGGYFTVYFSTCVIPLN